MAMVTNRGTSQM